MSPAEQIEKRIVELDSWRAETVKWIRRLVAEAEPALKEEWKWNNAAWSQNGLVLGLVAETNKSKDVVQLTFFQGAALQDPQRLFNAGLDSKAMRYIKIHQGDTLDETALRELIAAAIAHNQVSQS
jgi:hypothetical protein